MRTLLMLSFVLLLSGCATYQISVEDLVHQLKSNPAGAATDSLGVVRYTTEGIEKIRCRDGGGDLVYLYPTGTTQFAITSASSGEVLRVYFDTVVLEGNTLQGIRTRILAGVRWKIHLSDIETIEIINSEMAKTEKVKEGGE